MHPILQACSANVASRVSWLISFEAPLWLDPAMPPLSINHQRLGSRRWNHLICLLVSSFLSVSFFFPSPSSTPTLISAVVSVSLGSVQDVWLGSTHSHLGGKGQVSHHTSTSDPSHGRTRQARPCSSCMEERDGSIAACGRKRALLHLRKDGTDGTKDTQDTDGTKSVESGDKNERS